MNSYALFNKKQVNYLHNNGKYYGYHFKRGW